MKALGIHVFAGGFTMGVKAATDVEVLGQLEIHNFGRGTCESIGIDFINADDWDEWPAVKADMIYGNPRCTGFSCLTSGYSGEIHGPWAKCTKDIHDLCQYGLKTETPVIIWESVQQAASTGKLLLNHLRDNVFFPAGYNIMHVFINAATFGNPQRRKRYFFVAYKNTRRFNITPMPIVDRQYVMEFLDDVDGHTVKLCRKDAAYDAYSWMHFTKEETAMIPFLQQGECLNLLGKRDEDLYNTDRTPRFWEQWLVRNSNIPFSVHGLRRLHPDKFVPSLSNSCHHMIHPEKNRGLTVGELSAIMGWPDGIIPVGALPNGQIAKGIVPAIGQWLAEQVRDNYFGREWRGGEFQTKWDHIQGEWIENYPDDPRERVFDFTHYYDRGEQ